MDVRQRTNNNNNNGGITTSSTNEHNNSDLGISSSSTNNSNIQQTNIKKKSTFTHATPKQQIKAYMPILIVFCIIFSISLIGGIGIIYYISNDEADIDDNNIENNNEIINNYKKQINDMQSNIDKLNNDNKLLNDEMNTLKETTTRQIQEIESKQVQVQQDPNNNNSNVTKLNEKIMKLIDYKEKMHKEIQNIAKRLIIEKYGLGPHIIDMYIEYDPKSNIYTDTTKGGIITIELASINDMPSSIFYFLEQISYKLLNNCSFHRNAGHVVQGGPAANFLNIHGKSNDFKNALLYSVPYQE